MVVHICVLHWDLGSEVIMCVVFLCVISDLALVRLFGPLLCGQVGDEQRLSLVLSLSAILGFSVHILPGFRYKVLV